MPAVRGQPRDRLAQARSAAVLTATAKNIQERAFQTMLLDLAPPPGLAAPAGNSESFRIHVVRWQWAGTTQKMKHPMVETMMNK